LQLEQAPKGSTAINRPVYLNTVRGFGVAAQISTDAAKALAQNCGSSALNHKNSRDDN